MAFEIKKIKSGQAPNEIAWKIQTAIAQGGRFTARVEHHRNKVTIHDVRLTYKKDYCGNHPLPCPVRPGPHKKHKRLDYLEGADWVGFNDLLNDVLDSLGVVCDAGSSLVIIRKSGERCTYYDAQATPNGIDNEWLKDSGQFENHIGTNAPVSAAYPEGTPGFATAQGQPNYPEHHHH